MPGIEGVDTRALTKLIREKVCHPSTLVVTQGTDGSARKPALSQDADYMVEQTYHLAPYLDSFGVIFSNEMHLPY